MDYNSKPVKEIIYERTWHKGACPTFERVVEFESFSVVAGVRDEDELNKSRRGDDGAG